MERRPSYSHDDDDRQRERGRVYRTWMAPAQKQGSVMAQTPRGTLEITADNALRGTSKNHFYQVKVANTDSVLVQGKALDVSDWLAKLFCDYCMYLHSEGFTVLRHP